MSVTAAGGFRASGVAAGIKLAGLDLAVVATEKPAVAAAVFTVNRAPAAPVLISRDHLRRTAYARAVVVNSGCANAGTGSAGEHAAVATAEAAGRLLGCATDEVLLGSTGTIGDQLPVDRIVAGLAGAVGELAATAEAGGAAARAIMTTDRVPKEAVARRGEWTIGGMAKGAGMVRPDMATMLAVLTTDAVVPPDVADAALRNAVDVSFHSINIDGCLSTNDTVILLASGSAGVAPDPDEFGAALAEVCRDLARRLVEDAEGATRVVTIEVRGAADDATARDFGRVVADSALVRASFHGGDPNWGRMLGAMGAFWHDFDPGAVGVAYNGIPVARDGVSVEYDAVALQADLATGPFTVSLDVGAGPGRATVLATDLSPDYVRFNAGRS